MLKRSISIFASCGEAQVDDAGVVGAKVFAIRVHLPRSVERLALRRRRNDAAHPIELRSAELRSLEHFHRIAFC